MKYPYSGVNVRCIVTLIMDFRILVLHSVLRSTVCQVLMVASLTPQTNNPSIIAPSEFTVCVTCLPSFTTALERVSKAFNIEVPLYPTPTSNRDTCWCKDPSRWQYLTWQCSFFTLPRFSVTYQHHHPCPGPIYCPTVQSLHTRWMSCGSVHTHTQDWQNESR